MPSAFFADFVEDETRPLLGSSSSSLPSNETFPLTTTQLIGTKCLLPKEQLGLLCLLRALDPMCFTQIFPYINQFLLEMEVAADPSRVGIYSGLAESMFALFQLMSIYSWGHASDIIGRRPVVLTGVAGLSVATFSFGLSKTFSEVLIARAFAGIFSGNVAVIPSILCDITNSTNQSFAFSFFGLWWPTGAIIGPLIGGTFSNVSAKYPAYFKSAFFRDYPYFFPGFLISLASLSVLVLCYFYLDETLPMRQAPAPSLANNRSEYNHEKPSLRKLLSLPIIRALCISACVLSFISTAFDVIFVLFCYSPIDRGGLGFNASEIGIVLAISGLLAAAIQAFALPAALQHIHHANLYHWCIMIWPFSFFSLPCLSLIASHVSNAWVLWTCIMLSLLLVRLGYLSYSINMLLVKRYAPNSAALGSVNGLVQIFICLTRSVSPAFASTIFAMSATTTPLLGRHAWVLIMISISSVGWLCSRNLMICSMKEDKSRVTVDAIMHVDNHSAGF
ncbi:major facilitator superfamily domain-containing protein [Cyathus striatus]|nr:major facilitator superfamily domain-containing protein [Cyathus striatus]